MSGCMIYTMCGLCYRPITISHDDFVCNKHCENCRLKLIKNSYKQSLYVRFLKWWAK